MTPLPMTEEEQEARSCKFEPSGTVNLRQLSSGRWALYPIGGIGSPFWIGEISDLASAYALRPAPRVVSLPRQTATSKYKDLGLEITL